MGLEGVWVTPNYIWFNTFVFLKNIKSNGTSFPLPSELDGLSIGRD